MINITVHELNKYYGANHVLRGAGFEIYAGEKVGLLGRNGSGKTTVFRIIAGEEDYESGSVARASGKKVEMLAQIPVFPKDMSIDDILRTSFQDAEDVLAAMKKIEADADWANSAAKMKKYGELMEEYERLGGYEMDVKIDKICNGMSINEQMRAGLFERLSGGEKTRVNLARILLRDCDILLLDEPTNHLDLKSLQWLEGFLREFAGTVVTISHDRVFLDNTVKRIIEIEDGLAYSYSGNYSFFVKDKAERLNRQAEMYKQQQRKIKQLEDTAQMLFEGNRYGRRHLVLQKRIDMMDKVEKPTTTRRINEDFKNASQHGSKRVVALENVSKSFGDKVILDNVSLEILRNNIDAIALIGENGCGKTTLLRMITGEIPCDAGVVKIGESTKIAYLPQIVQFDNEQATVLETVRRNLGLDEGRARAVLAKFKFRGDDVAKVVARLSGGERSRLRLCLMMQNEVYLLILDEPTNHLDIESREWIEEAVEDFDCALLFVSHDRYFLNKFASRVWSMKDGGVEEFYGGYEECLRAADEIDPNIVIRHKKEKRRPLAGQEQAINNRPYDSHPAGKSLEGLILEAEAELERIDAALAEVSDGDYLEMDRLYLERMDVERRIEGLYGEME